MLTNLQVISFDKVGTLFINGLLSPGSLTHDSEYIQNKGQFSCTQQNSDLHSFSTTANPVSKVELPTLAQSCVPAAKVCKDSHTKICSCTDSDKGDFDWLCQKYS